MSVTRLPSGRWRAQVYDPVTGTNVSVSTLLGGPGTFATKTEAKRAREKARERLGESREAGITLAAFWSAGRPIRCSLGRRSPRTSTIASGRRGLWLCTARGRSVRSMTP